MTDWVEVFIYLFIDLLKLCMHYLQPNDNTMQFLWTVDQLLLESHQSQ